MSYRLNPFCSMDSTKLQKQGWNLKKDLLKIVEGPVRSGYQKIAKDLITQSVIQQFLTRTLGANEALKQSQKWLKFVNKKW